MFKMSDMAIMLGMKKWININIPRVCCIMLWQLKMNNRHMKKFLFVFVIPFWGRAFWI